jgi:ferric-dicitrate binding protein FerR (iron transport regulator)
MKREVKDLDGVLDQVLDGMRSERADEQVVDDAAARVWQQIESEAQAHADDPAKADPIRDCADFQALIPAYITDSLSDARSLLLEDHVRECVPCRKSLKQARAGRSQAAPAAPRSARRVISREWTWAAAAAVLVAVTLFGLRIDFLGVSVGGIVTIQQLDGEAFRVTAAGTVPVSAGDQIQLGPNGDTIRTAKGSTAMLELSDGSKVEMKERSQLAVYERRSRLSGERTDSTIDLDRGGIIVEAAEQAGGHLYVETDDAKVAVTGTVFSVSHGTKGSRVSVFEGEVEVDQARQEDVLHPGDQVVTSPLVTRVALADEIAWSRNVDKHLALLAELTSLGKELDELIAGPGLRNSTRLLDRAPADTVVYVAIPNIAEQLGNAYDHVQSKVQTNPVLREWWQTELASCGADAEMNAAIERVRDFGEQLGEEVVVAVRADENGEIQPPVVMAELARPAEFLDFVVGQFNDLKSNVGGETPDFTIFQGSPPKIAFNVGGDSSESFYLWLDDGFMAASPDMDSLQAFGGFSGSSFHGRLSDLYRRGVEWVVGVDLGYVLDLENKKASEEERGLMDRMGLLDIRHLIIDHRNADGRSDTRAVLSFDHARRGMAAWLAEPAPMGSLEFISPGASFAAAFVMKEPASLLDELVSVVPGGDFQQHLDEFKAKHGVDIRADFAAPLGGEFAFAVDGPWLPKPSFKLIMEVYNPAQLQQSLEWAVGQFHQLAIDNGRKGFELETEKAGGQTFRAIRSIDTGIAVYYTFADSYMVAAPSRALLTRALDNRKAGFTLASSNRFTALLPKDGRLDFSAVAYQDLGGVVGPLVNRLNSMSGLDEEQTEMLDAIAANTSASLAYAYGQPESITVAASSEGGFFGSGLSLFSLDSMLDFQQSISDAHQLEGQ